MVRRRNLSPSGREPAQVDALREPHSHQKCLIGFFGAAEGNIFDDPVIRRLRRAPPTLRTALRARSPAHPIDDETTVRARADADIFAVAPVGAGCAGFPRPALAWLEIS